MKKKLIGILLAVCMLFSMAVPVSADVALEDIAADLNGTYTIYVNRTTDVLINNYRTSSYYLTLTIDGINFKLNTTTHYNWSYPILNIEGIFTSYEGNTLYGAFTNETSRTYASYEAQGGLSLEKISDSELILQVDYRQVAAEYIPSTGKTAARNYTYQVVEMPLIPQEDAPKWNDKEEYLHGGTFRWNGDIDGYPYVYDKVMGEEVVLTDYDCELDVDGLNYALRLTHNGVTREYRGSFADYAGWMQEIYGGYITRFYIGTDAAGNRIGGLIYAVEDERYIYGCEYLEVIERTDEPNPPEPQAYNVNVMGMGPSDTGEYMVNILGNVQGTFREGVNVLTFEDVQSQNLSINTFNVLNGASRVMGINTVEGITVTVTNGAVANVAVTGRAQTNPGGFDRYTVNCSVF